MVLLLLLLLVVLLAMLLAISSPAKAGGISRRLINNEDKNDYEADWKELSIWQWLTCTVQPARWSTQLHLVLNPTVVPPSRGLFVRHNLSQQIATVQSSRTQGWQIHPNTWCSKLDLKKPQLFSHFSFGMWMQALLNRPSTSVLIIHCDTLCE